jgi:hypothetical protein
MITGTLSNGFKYEADERILSDFRLVDAIAMIESEDNAESDPPAFYFQFSSCHQAAMS